MVGAEREKNYVERETNRKKKMKIAATDYGRVRNTQPAQIDGHRFLRSFHVFSLASLIFTFIVPHFFFGLLLLRCLSVEVCVGEFFFSWPFSDLCL